MHILMISDVHFPRINGVSTSIATFREDLEALGHRVTLVAPAYPGDRATRPGDLRIAARRLPFDPEDRLMQRRALRAAEPRIAALAIDVIHVHTPFAAHGLGCRLARRLGLPLVESYHTFFEQYLDHYLPRLLARPLRPLARRIARRQCNAVDRLVVPSSAMARVLEGYGVTTPMEVIPTGVAPSAFTPGDGGRFRREHGIEPGRPVLCHVGRVAHEKNIGFLLAVLERVRRQVPDVLLIIAGEGPAREALRQAVAERGLAASVLFVGYLDRAVGLKDCYRAGDLFVFASRTETQGLVLLEAMAQGVPVASTAVMGTTDIVGPERGAIALPEEAENFAAAVTRLLADHDARARMADAARAFAREWSAEAMAGALADCYIRAASARVGGDPPAVFEASP